MERRRVFQSLKIEDECKGSFIPIDQGGARLHHVKLLPLLPETSRDLFVSSTARAPFTGSRSNPFNSIAEAIQASRGQSGGTKRIVVLPGEAYRITETIVLGSLDQGLRIEGVTGDNGERPRITSTLSLDSSFHWERFSDNGVVRAKLPTHVIELTDTLSHLYINGKAAIRARFPNINNPLDYGYASSRLISSWGRRQDTPPTMRQVHQVVLPFDNPLVQYQPSSTRYNRFTMAFGGQCDHFVPAASYFCHPRHQAQGGCEYSLPKNVRFKREVVPGPEWTDASTAYFHSLHWWGWGLWTWSVRSQWRRGITFGPGGWQEARGDCGKGGGDWWVENVLELLDSPNEFFLDRKNGYIYYYPPSQETNPLLESNLRVELSTKLRNFVVMKSTEDVVIRNLEFFGAYATHMDAFEAPSGGDWTFHRGAVVYMENVTNVKVQDCAFYWCMGNAIMVSRHARDVDIERNDIFATGSSSILVVGDPNFESRTPWIIRDFPKDVRVRYNSCSNFGIFVKQSAGVFVTISKGVIVEHNVVYQGPRGGIVFNDGYGGSHVVRRNLIFQTVLETNDHGPFDTWDRQQYIEPYLRVMNIVEENLVLGTDKGPKGIDFDDGTYNWLSRNNVVVWGYQKFKGSYIHARNNLFLYPLESSCAFITPQVRGTAK